MRIANVIRSTMKVLNLDFYPSEGIPRMTIEKRWKILEHMRRMDSGATFDENTDGLELHHQRDRGSVDQTSLLSVIGCKILE